MKKILTLIFALIAMASVAFADPDAEPNYLCFEVKAGTTVSLYKNGNVNPNIQYSFDKKTWNDFSELTVENDCCIYFKGVNPNGLSTSFNDCTIFRVSKDFKCSGNIMTLIDGVGETKEVPPFCFYRLFEDCPMTTAPMLPATTLAEACYCAMFEETKIETTPVLPATKLARSCYATMFAYCPLTTAPELPATVLASGCYWQMFQECTQLTEAPELPATTLANNCYYRMFDGCQLLQKIKVGFNSWPENGFTEWMQNVNGKGIFICPSDLPQQFGINYIPEGWIVNSQNKTFTISSSNQFVTIDKTFAKYNDKVTFSVANRTSDGYKLDKVLVNNKEVAISNYAASFDMMNYLSDVNIQAIYSKITYTISTDEYSQASNSTANIGDIINVAFTQREGYNLTYATFKGKTLTVNNYTSTFTMPAANVDIKTIYEPIDHSKIEYLCFEVKAGTTVSLKKVGEANPNIQYSFDKKKWNNFSELTVGNDCYIYFKGVNLYGFSTSSSDYSSFVVSKEFKCSGNIMALIDGIGVTTTIPNSYCFVQLFKDCPLTTAPELPATNLAEHCYEYMFSGCTSLTTAPELPATNLAEHCYAGMFGGCTSLNTAPKLPATTLAEHCYEVMFGGCTSLTTAPKLPATTLAVGCYELMFYECTSLTTAPELPATNLAEYCYAHMFAYCTSLTAAPKLRATKLADCCCWEMFLSCTNLTTAPELPATTLTLCCYAGMFSGCSSLNTAPKLPATTLAVGCYECMFSRCTRLTAAPELPATNLAERCYQGMFNGCSQLKNITVAFNTWPENVFVKWVQNVSDKGVFFCPSGLPQQFGISYIPEGWIVNPQNKNFAIGSQSEYVIIDKTSAKYNEKVNFSVADRTKDSYKLDKVLANNKEVAVSNYTGSLDMMDYLSDVNIQAIYSKITYTISTDDYSQANKVSATVDDDITITFKQREGFDLVSATYNGNKLIVNNYKASFTMPAQDVEIKTVYNENNPKTPVSEIYSDNCVVNVFPNPAKSGEEITLKVGGKVDTNNTKIYIYNASGSLVMLIDDVKEYNQLTLKSGVYVGVLVAKGGKKTFRVAVK